MNNPLRLQVNLVANNHYFLDAVLQFAGPYFAFLKRALVRDVVDKACDVGVAVVVTDVLEVAPLISNIPNLKRLNVIVFDVLRVQRLNFDGRHETVRLLLDLTLRFSRLATFGIRIPPNQTSLANMRIAQNNNLVVLLRLSDRRIAQRLATCLDVK